MMAKLDQRLKMQKMMHLKPVYKLMLSSLLCLSVAIPASAQEITRSPLQPLTVDGAKRSPVETIAPTTSIRVQKPTTQSATSSSGQACEGKLGVHRTITVSPKNTFLVGVDNHARIGLKKKEIVLTFDDGPRAGITEPILRALAKECVLATFFAMGRSVREHPHLLARAAKEGHTIGTHTQSHPLLTKRNNDGVAAEVRRGIASAEAALEGSGHKLANFFRYPYLARSKRTDKIVKGFGLVGFHMNIDSWDWKDQTPEQMLQTTLRRTRGEGSGIVLFHDIQEKTAVALPKYLRILRQEGYKIVHLIPGDSDFNFRQDLASRVPTPLVRPAYASNAQSGAIIPASTGDAAITNGLTDSTAVASVAPKATDVTDGSSLDGSRENAAARLRALALKKNEAEKEELARQERAKKLATLPQPPLPKRKPRRRKVAAIKPKSNITELRGSQSTNSEPLKPVVIENPGDQQIVSVTEGLEPARKKKKKKRFRRLRSIFTDSSQR
ncbi:MAG: polysaccharide deacetylase family protein [Hyphomicrobiales bacterium]